MSGFNRYGLYRDDCLNYEDPDVIEAVRRLPQDVRDERNFRIFKAIHHSMLKTYLPENEWTCYEKDLKYLEPYLNEVKREREERDNWKPCN